MKQLNDFLTLTKINWQKHGLAVFGTLAMLFAIPLTGIAQITSATITGTITDQSGAAVPAASVTARNIDTGLTRTVTTGDDGFYRLEFIPVGNYEIEVSATSGFKKANQAGIVLRVGDTVRVDVSLEVGGLDEVVTVSTAPPEVNTSNAELGRTVQTEEIENLPLVERNVFALLDLTPGVQSNNAGISNTAQGNLQSTLGFPEQRTLINGGTDGGTGSVNYFLDGGTNMTNLRNTGNVAPNPEAIREFKVTTNAYGAEYGRFASGIINIITKSGTNSFNGSVYEYVRNDAFNANEYKSVLEKAPYKRNQFGGSFGGPIIKDRTFFFATYSGLRQNTSRFLSGATLPTALERMGNFSLSGTKPKDPATGTSVPTGTFFPGNIIPANRIDPVALRILNEFIPQSNFTNANGSPGYQGNVPLPVATDEILVKVDHQLNEPHRLSFTYFTNWGNQTFFPGSGNVDWATQNFKWQQTSANLSDVWVISPDKINQFWVTYTRSFGGRNNTPETTLEDLGSTFRTQGKGSLPQITVNGFFTLSNAIGGPTAGTNLYSVRDVFSWNKGNHSLKFGGELTLNKDIQDVLLNNYGVFTFNNTASGNAFADFLLGVPSGLTQDAPVTGYTNTWYTALFLQDDFRATPKLNLNLGLRWDVQTPPTDPLDRWTNYVPGQRSTVRPTAPLGALFVGDPGVERGAIAVSYKQFSPRLGFAYDPKGDGKTSIRGSMGLFYGSISGNEWNTMTNFQPASTRLSFTANLRRNGSGATLANPYTNYPGGIPFPYTGTFATGGGFFAVAQDFQFPRTLQMNFSVQRQITSQISVGAAYIRSVARNLPFGRDVNAPVNTITPVPTTGNVLARRPNTAFGAVTVLDSDQSADYEGLQITGAMRFNRLFTFNGFYTLSKTTSSVQLHNNTTQGLAQNHYDLRAEYGAADTDQRHVFSGSFNFRPDFYNGDNRFAKVILNGWSISPIIKIRSGRPFTVTNGGVDANLDGVTGTDRAQLIGDPYLANRTAERWFNTAAFARNVTGTGVPPIDGNSPRNFLYGPGYRVVDLALSRDFKFGDRIKLRFRAEGTNILNIVNLDQPNSAVPATPTSTSTFGSISGASSMRIIQLGVRLSF